jgi:RNA polymerase sigma-70 factor (ECF subfamily)
MDEFTAPDERALRESFRRLHYRHQDRVRGLLRLKLPAEHVDDATQEVFVRAWEALAGGQDIQAFGPWLNTVVARTVADFWRGRQGRAVQVARDGVALDDDRDDAPGRRLGTDGGYGAVDAGLVVEELLRRRSSAHQAIIRQAVLRQRPAAEVARATGESADNIYQVAKRFRDDLRATLAAAEQDPRTEDRN